MELESLSEAIDALIERGAECFGDGESMSALHRQAARLDGFITEAAAVFDAQGEWADDGAKTSAAWIAKRCRVPRSAARKRVRLGRVLRGLPACAEAWRNGDIGVDQAKALSSLHQPRTEEALERDEEMLVAQAKKMGFEDFYRALCYWKHLADPEGADRDDEERRAERNVYLEASFDGMWLGQMTLDPISGTIVSNQLKRLEKDLFAADWVEAKERLGREPKVDELKRTAGQRRADALVEMATRSATAPADGLRPVPLFSILVGYETLYGRICEIENGIVLAPGTLMPYMEAAYFERAVFAPGNRIDVSVRSRFFTGGTRRALELRDRMCTHPYCYEPADNCEADHVETWASGGQTTQENGRLLCAFHNRMRNQREQSVRSGRPPPGAAK
jgi:hypothetical protein